MKKSRLMVISLLLGILFLGPMRAYGEESLSFQIMQYDTLDGHAGYIQEMRINDALHETDFLFEENGYIRWYSYKMSWQDEFQVLPEGTYLVKKDDLNIGDTWNSWSGGPTVSEVVDTATINVPAGTFFTYVIDQYDGSNFYGTTWIAYNSGTIKIDGGSGAFNLEWLDVVSNGSYYPLAVGNRWEYLDSYNRDTLSFNIDSTTFIFGAVCYAMNMHWGSYWTETEYFSIDNDTVYFRGYKEPGQQPVEDYYVSTPLFPAVGTDWYAKWGGERVRYYVEEERMVSTPAGDFDAYLYSISDSISGTPVGYWYASDGNGIIGWGIYEDNDTLSYLLSRSTINGGNGVWPLDVGNQWILALEGLTDIPVDGESTIPRLPALFQNYPNPFNAMTTIKFDIETPGDVRLEVYNLMGQKVTTLVDDYLESGSKTTAWDASEFSSGIYFYKLNTGNGVITKRMTLIK